jgi:hypothetical protein
MSRKHAIAWAATVAATVGLAGTAGAVKQTIGDVDGFGFTSTVGLVRATPAPHTSPADTDGDGLLEAGEYLPDLNKDGVTDVSHGDDFDHRGAAEVPATNGAQYRGAATASCSSRTRWCRGRP